MMTEVKSTTRRNSALLFLENRLAVLGLVIIAVFALMVLLHPLLMNTLWAGKGIIYDPVRGYDAPTMEATVVEVVTDPNSEIELFEARLADITTNVGDVVVIRIQPAPPSLTHWLGTDVFGRDVFSMLLAGAWPTFVVGFSAAIVSAAVGTTMAVASATFRGRTDRVLSRVSDVLLLLPAPLAMIVLGAAGGDLLTPLGFGVLYGLLAGASTAAIVLRSHALATVERPFIDAARVSGASGWHLAWRHLVPHLVPLAAVTMVTAVVGAVVAHGFASWLAYSEDLTNWGAMMFIAIGFASLQGVFAWNVLIAGAAAISIFCAAFYLVSLGLRDAAFRVGGTRQKRPGWTRSKHGERARI
jgi:ABC-type dipeptide/oligopeptide/nickel transport system permease subunit